MPLPAFSKLHKQPPGVHRGNGNSAVAQPSAEASSHHEGPTRTSSNNQGPSLRPHHTRTLSFQNDVDGSRRRSFLPQPGQTKYSSNQDTAPSGMDTANAPPPGLGRLRPRSMYQPSTAPSTHGKVEEPAATSRSIRPPNAMSKPSEPPMTALGRSKSLRKPGTSTLSAQPTTSGTHARTQPTSKTLGLRKESNIESSVARPRSLAAPGHSKPNGIAADSAPSVPRASARLAGLSRIASVKTKPDSTRSGAAPQLASKPDESVASHSRQRGIQKDEPAKMSRPAFSTLQQHFTPRKVGKAPTSTFLHPAPDPGVNSLPLEIINLQSELLQLHLLHAASADVTRQWHLSARRSLHKKFEELASLHQAMLEYERAGQEQKNIQALLEWSSATSSSGLIEYIQILSGPLHELPTLLEPGGRSARLTTEFHHWISRVEQIWAARQNAQNSEADAETIETLGDDWKAENAALTRKVTYFARDLELVPQPSPGSSIACLVDGCRELVSGLADELHVMQVIESNVVEKEKEWVETRLQAIASGDGLDWATSLEGVAAWRR